LSLNAWRFVTLLLAALALTMESAHVLAELRHAARLRRVDRPSGLA
jgi:hypothetical protein